MKDVTIRICSICGVMDGKKHNWALHDAFEALKGDHASEPLSPARKQVQAPKPRDEQPDPARRRRL